MPYIRGSRRSVGIGGFLLNRSAIQWDGTTPFTESPTGTPFADRVAIASFMIDVHEMNNYQPGNRSCYPPYVPYYEPYYNDRNVLPFSIPLRALTNQKFDQNFLVAGKTIASSFLASSAVRLHPGEWATGSAAGAVAATLVKTGGGGGGGGGGAGTGAGASGMAGLLRDPSALAHAVAVAKNPGLQIWGKAESPF